MGTKKMLETGKLVFVFDHVNLTDGDKPTETLGVVRSDQIPGNSITNVLLLLDDGSPATLKSIYNENIERVNLNKVGASKKDKIDNLIVTHYDKLEKMRDQYAKRSLLESVYAVNNEHAP